MGTYTYQIEYVGHTTGILPKINFSHKVRYRINPGVIIFLLRYLAGVDSTSPPRTNDGKLSKVAILMDFGRQLRLPNIYIYMLCCLGHQMLVGVQEAMSSASP